MKISYKSKRMVVAFMTVVFLLQAISASFGLRISAKTNTMQNTALTDAKGKDYDSYLKEYSGEAAPITEIPIKASGFLKNEDNANIEILDNFEGREKVLKWNASEGVLHWNFNVEKAGFYCLKLDYYVINDNAVNLQLKMKLDGEVKFKEHEYLTFPRLYKDSSQITSDEAGNDIRPTQAALRKWLSYTAESTEGNCNEPFSFYLTKGNHSVSFEGVSVDAAIDTIVFYNDEPVVDYKTYAKGAKAVSDEYVKIYQAEKTFEKSDRKLYPQFDNTSVDTVPQSPVNLKLNTIGAANFSTIGQFMTWQVEVPESGYYYIGLRARQNLSVGLTSYRRLLINGKLPFKEANMIAFHFNQKWQSITLGDEEPWLFYLDKGTNTLTLQVVSGPAAGLTSRIKNLVQEINFIYRKIIMVTGTNPDAYRDYQIGKEIPELGGELKLILEETKSIISESASYGNDETGDLSSLQELSRLLEGCIKDIDSVPLKASKLQSYSSTLSALATSINDMPLELDYIVLSTDEPAKEMKSSGFWSQLIFDLKSFIGSFSTDYNTIGVTEKSDKKITVWVSLGRDQTQTVKLLAGSTFTPNTGISVDIKLVQQSLVYASLSGRGPDVVLFVEEGDPVNLALRGALAPMDKFSTFDEVTKRFSEQSLVPFKFNGSTYAIPLQQNFPMLFYRTDIFAELGLEVPTTWEEFYNVIQVLQRNNMTAGLPNMESGSAMITNNKIFAMFLEQNGGTYYNEELSKTALDSNVAVSSFTMWTDFYKNYGLEYQYDFYNRFVSGEMPIGINTYTLYNKFMTAATEIRGAWEIVPVPGIVNESGELNSKVCGTVTGAVILERCSDKQSAWEFIDWFTRADTQSAFGLEIEALLGPAGRYDTANIEAFKKLPWTETEKKLILNQWSNMFELHQVPGGYYVDRNLTNAFRKVVFYGKNPRETLMNYNQQINREIERKRQEFGLE